MTINVTWQNDCRFQVVTEAGFEVFIDADNKSAPCPTEILLSALGSCSATDVTLYFKDNDIELKSLNNRLTYQLTKTEPRLYKSVNLHFSIEAKGVSETLLNKAIEEAINKYCHVCLMLQPAMHISHSVEIINS
ncbi:OsmC family protein [Colwellia psychrerythraea]|uniref:OsmC family protein n=1 Tax=Colwellia psychrerythraea TaxID=28229 RepID=A0A099KAY1_COLPS|nr:OsmC family protein [Colwellia psychrerythraea]KGJ86753.1 OsmC family protein [Colwellia psychrerythraea]